MKIRVFSLLLALAILLTGCNLLPDAGEQPREVSESSIWAMDTQMDLRLYGDTDGVVMAELTATLNRLDHTLSATAADSALTALNESGWTDDRDIVYLASNARKISEQTGGALDITLLPVSRLWGFTTGSYGVPAAADLEALRDRVGMDKLSLTDESVSVPAGTKLDFGALAKGYAADLCRARMEEAGLSGLLALGGNIQTVGTKPDGSDWIIGVQDPNDAGRYILTLRLTGSKAAVSSGDYQRYFVQDSVRYCHILDPETLAPVRGSLRSVTVVANEGLLADGLSTALYVLGREAGTELWRQRGNFEAVWIEDDGVVWVTPGLKDRIADGDCQVIEP
jgi:thiamine biosynthesis lipoprotein